MTMPMQSKCSTVVRIAVRYSGCVRFVRLALVAFTFASVFSSAQTKSACGLLGHDLFFIGTHGVVKGHELATETSELAEGSFATRQGIHSACLDETTGRIALLEGAADVNQASWLLVDSLKSVLYSTGLAGDNLQSSGLIYGFSVERTSGRLRLINSAPAGGQDPTSLALDAGAARRTLFSANHGGGNVTALQLRDTGAVGEVEASQQDSGSGPHRRQRGPQPHCVVLDPSGRFLITADFGADRLFVSQWDAASKALTPTPAATVSLPAGSGPRQMKFSPDGKLLFVNTELTANVLVYRWDAAASQLQLLSTTAAFPPDYTKEKSTSGIAISSDGKFLYLLLRGSENAVVVYRIDGAAGNLRELQRIGTGGETPWSFALSPSGRWLVIANTASSSISVLSRKSSTGMLSRGKKSFAIVEPTSLAFFDDHAR